MIHALWGQRWTRLPASYRGKYCRNRGMAFALSVPRLPCPVFYGRHGSRGAVAEAPNCDTGSRPRLVSMRRPRNRFKASARASSGDGYRAAPATPCLLAHLFAPPRRTSNRQERRAGRPLGRERPQPRYPSEQEFPAGADFHSDHQQLQHAAYQNCDTTLGLRKSTPPSSELAADVAATRLRPCERPAMAWSGDLAANLHRTASL